jgi:hypothetical protein
MNVDLERLSARVERLERSEHENICLRAELRRERRRFRVLSAIAVAALAVTVWAFPANREAIAKQADNLHVRVAALELVTKFFSVAADPVTGTQDLYITGTNVHIRNSATPENANGLGNLTIGRNTSRTIAGGTDERTGSHNLVMGGRNNYTGESGIVTGDFNTIEGFESTTIGGGGNTANTGALILGGRGNDADTSALIIGGRTNFAQHDGVVVGGHDNFAGSFEGNVAVGGQGTRATGSFNTAIGGQDIRCCIGRDHGTVVGGL